MNQDLLDAFNSTQDGDEWGNYVAWHMATAHVLHHEFDNVPAEWEFGHSPYCDRLDTEDYEELELVFLMDTAGVTEQDLLDFGNMLKCLRTVLVAEGKNY